MLDIFNWNEPLEDWWHCQIRYWSMEGEWTTFLLNLNLNSWSF